MQELLNKLTEQQAEVALEIARKAKEMGIDPKLAVTLAFRESGLNANTKNGTKGEIGLMQVMPKTAEMMGFTVDDLKNQSKNIEIGLTYLKQGLDKFNGDPLLAAAGYNAGHNHPYFVDPDKSSLPDSTKQYLKDIAGYGGFATNEPEPAPVPVEEVASESDFMANKARLAADAIGMGAGAAAAKGLDMAQNVSQTAAAIRQIPGALAAAQAPAATAPSAPAGAPMARPVAGGPAGPVGGPVSPLQQMGGSGAYNYGKAFGLSDIEAARATDMSKNPGGANDLIKQRSASLQKVQQLFPNQFVENPNYGGIMTPQQGGGGVPRANFVQSPAGLTQIPVAAPISAVPPPPPPPPSAPGPLSQAAGASRQAAGAVLRSPITMGALGGLSMAESGQETQKRLQQGDETGAAIAATGGVGGMMQMMPNPRIRAIGAAVSAVSPLTQYLRDKLRAEAPGPEPTPEELMQAERPAFRYARP